MTIYVTRKGQNIAANVLFNFKQSPNVVILKLHPTFFTKEEDIVLVYDMVDQKWIEIDDLDEREPLFFQHLIYRLSHILTLAEKNTNEVIKKEGFFRVAGYQYTVENV